MKEVTNTNTQSGNKSNAKQGANAPAGNGRSNDASRSAPSANQNGGQSGGQSGKSSEGRAEQHAGADGKNAGRTADDQRSNSGNGKSAAPSGSQAPKAGGHVRADQIKPDMPVVCSEDGEFATVDHMEGKDTIKLKKDEDGKHHFIPLSWVTSVDDQVHIDRSGDQAMKQWRAEA